MLNRRDRGQLLRADPPTPGLRAWGEQWSLDDSRREVMMPGTPVVIMGAYPFGTPAAWLSIDALSAPIALPATLAAAATTPRRSATASAAVAAGSGR